MTDHTSETDQIKRCCKCHSWKSLDSFGKDRHRKTGIRPVCKTCEAEYQANRRKENPDAEKETRRKWYQANKERAKRNNRKWYSSLDETSRAKRNENSRLWKRLHGDHRRIWQNTRRSRERNAPGVHTTEDMRRQYDSQKGKCWHCGKPVRWEDRHEDHLIPLSRGGTNWPNNMVISCAKCNWSKNDSLPYEWNGKLF